MINVKAFKAPDQDPKPLQDIYAAKDTEKASFLPVAFLLFLVGVATYVKSFFGGEVEARPEPKREEERAEADLPREGEASGAARGPDMPVDETDDKPSNVVPMASRIGSSQAPGSFLAADSPPIDFSGLPAGPASRPERPVDPHPKAINDNDAGSGEAVASSGGSSGSGGGGSSRGQPDAEPDDDLPDDEPDEPDESRNRAPRLNGPVALQDVVGCQAYFISTTALLAGAVDPDGDPLSLASLYATSGTLAPMEGGWMFTADAGMLGAVQLTYRISDGTDTVHQVASFRVVEAPPIVGTDEPDNLLGTHCADAIDGGGGDDNIDARGGNDVIFGGAGDDHILGGAGDDIIYAGAGNDIVFAGVGNDIVFGGAGNDRLFGEAGDDIISGEGGDDLIAGGMGNDTLLAGAGSDTVYGDAGDDRIDGGESSDVLAGGAGHDVMFGGAGDDVVAGNEGDDVLSDGVGRDMVDGGDGDDRVIAAADAADDVHAGDAGNDTLDYSAAIEDIVIDVAGCSAEGGDIGRDQISGFEDFIGGCGDDRIVAGTGSITMTGGEGRDTFEFRRPDDGDDRPDIVRRITDFTVGDRLIMSNYEFHRRDDDDDRDRDGDEEGGRFEEIYFSDGDSERLVRFRFEQLGEEHFTFVELYDGDDLEQYHAIELLGDHRLQYFGSIS